MSDPSRAARLAKLLAERDDAAIQFMDLQYGIPGPASDDLIAEALAVIENDRPRYQFDAAPLSDRSTVRETCLLPSQMVVHAQTVLEMQAEIYRLRMDLASAKIAVEGLFPDYVQNTIVAVKAAIRKRGKS